MGSLIFEESDEKFRTRRRRRPMSKTSFGFLTGCVSLASIIIILVLPYPDNIIFVGAIAGIWGLACMQYWMESAVTPVQFKLTSEGIYFPTITRSRKNAYLAFRDIHKVVEQPVGNLIFYPVDIGTKCVFNVDDRTVGDKQIQRIRRQLQVNGIEIL